MEISKKHIMRICMIISKPHGEGEGEGEGEERERERDRESQKIIC